MGVAPNDFFRQLEITITPSEVHSWASLHVWARVRRRGVDRRRLLLAVDLDCEITDLDVAQTLAAAGELISREAFRMQQPAHQAPARDSDLSRRVPNVLNRFKSLQ